MIHERGQVEAERWEAARERLWLLIDNYASMSVFHNKAQKRELTVYLDDYDDVIAALGAAGLLALEIFNHR